MRKLNSKFWKIPVVALVLCAIAGIAFLAGTQSSNSSPYLTEEYAPNVTFSNLDINIIVNENGAYDISETFDVTINSAGLTEIIRYIPYYTSVEHLKDDGSVEEKILYAKICKCNIVEIITIHNSVTLL